MKKILAALIATVMIYSGTALANVQSARECAMTVIPYAFQDLTYPELVYEVARVCEGELVMLVAEAGLVMPADPEEYKKALMDVSAGMTGEILRQGVIEYFKEALRCKV